MVQGKIDQDPGDGHIHPNRPSHSGDLPVLIDPTSEPTPDGRESQRHDCNRQDDVAHQHHAVNGKDHPGGTQRGMHPFDQDLVSNIGDEEDAGTSER